MQALSSAAGTVALSRVAPALVAHREAAAVQSPGGRTAAGGSDVPLGVAGGRSGSRASLPLRELRERRFVRR